MFALGHIEKKQLKGGIRYYVRYRDPAGIRKTHGGFRLKMDAEASLRKIEAELASGNYGKRGDCSFECFSETWLRKHATLKKPSTQDDYTGVVRHHLIPYFSRMMLNSVTPAHVQEYVTTKQEAGAHPRTINKTIMVLKLMLKHAVIWGYIKG